MALRRPFMQWTRFLRRPMVKSIANYWPARKTETFSIAKSVGIVVENGRGVALGFLDRANFFGAWRSREARHRAIRTMRRRHVKIARLLLVGTVVLGGLAGARLVARVAVGAKAALAQTTEQSAANMVSRTTKAFNYRA